MRGAFFNEIRLRRVKLLCSEIGLSPCEIAFGSLDVEFYFTFAIGRYFTMATPLFHILRSKIFHFTTINTYDILQSEGRYNMAESKLKDLSMSFSVDILKLCDSIKGHYSIVNQLERSATSIGANIHEANYAQSKADFIAKLQIALKECYETEYWIELFIKSGIIDKVCVKSIYNTCGTI